MNIDYSTLPPHMQDAAHDYIEHGTPPGGFLHAVLSNNLVGAYSTADQENTDAMLAWASWLYNQAPSSAWGSEEKIRAWIAKGGLREGS